MFAPVFFLLQLLYFHYASGGTGSITPKAGSVPTANTLGAFKWISGEVVVSLGDGSLSSTTSFIVKPFSNSTQKSYLHEASSVVGIWTGQATDGRGTMSVKVGSNGLLVGSISDNDYSYELISRVGGTYTVNSYETASLPRELPPFEGIGLDRSLRSQQLVTRESIESFRDDRKLQTIFEVDLLVVYTYNSMCYAARYDPPCQESNKTVIEDLIKMAVDETNIALELSGVDNIRIRLVKMHLDTTGYEAPNVVGGLQVALDAIRKTNDGQLDYVHALRTQVGADVVFLWVDNAFECGLTMRLLNPQKDQEAFGVLNFRCKVIDYSFSHELGHSFGCRHDRYTEGCFSRTCNGYEYGYQDPDRQFRSIMAFNQPCNCSKALRYSNDEFLYQGKPIGITNVADCARTISENGPFVAQFRDKSPLYPTPSPVALLQPGASCVFNFQCASGNCYKVSQICQA